MITTKITVKAHLAEYLQKKYGVEGKPYIQIPPSDDLYHILYDLMSRRPECTGTHAPAPDFNLEIALPHRSTGKNPEVYNHLSIRAQKIIEEKVDRIFKAEMHLYVDEMSTDFGMTYTDATYTFKESYNIDSISEDALVKDYYRYRRKIGRKKKRKQKYTRNI